MRALIRDGDGPASVVLPEPRPGPGQVRVRVAWAARCLTDERVARGEIQVRTPRVLGHEATGVVEGGPRDGERVALWPLARCGACPGEREGGRCGRPLWLGIDEDGAFAEAIVVRAEQAVPVPRALPLDLAVMAEPLAAALGVLDALGPTTEPVHVPGADRIAILLRRTLAAAGVATVIEAAPGTAAVSVDCAGLDAAIAALKPGGTVLLRGRAPIVALPLAAVVDRGLRLQAAPHGSPRQALAWLAEGRVAVEDLFGPVFSLVDDHAREISFLTVSAPGKLRLQVSGAA